MRWGGGPSRRQLLPMLLWAAPVIPLTGLQPIAYHVGGFSLLSAAIAGRRAPLRMRASDRALAGFVLAYVGSLVLAWTGGAPGDRLIGSAYNLSLWLVGLSLLVGLGSSARAHLLRNLLRAATLVFYASCLFALVAAALWAAGVRDLVIQGAGPSADSALLSTGNRLVLVQQDFFLGGPMPRTSGFSNYATAYGAVHVLSGVATVCAARLRVVRLGVRIAFLAPGAIVGALLSGSRGVLLGVGAMWVAAFLLQRRRGFRSWLSAGAAALLLATAVLAVSADTEDSRSDVGVRRGSTETRLALYDEAMDVWARSPLMGSGVKPLEGRFPIGSHSTYVGVLMRTGLLGSSLLILFWFRHVRELLRIRRRHRGEPAEVLAWGALLTCAFLAAWCIGEDLDAPQLVAFMAFLLLGLPRLAVATTLRESPRTAGAPVQPDGRRAAQV